MPISSSCAFDWPVLFLWLFKLPFSSPFSRLSCSFNSYYFWIWHFPPSCEHIYVLRRMHPHESPSFYGLQFQIKYALLKILATISPSFPLIALFSSILRFSHLFLFWSARIFPFVFLIHILTNSVHFTAAQLPFVFFIFPKAPISYKNTFFRLFLFFIKYKKTIDGEGISLSRQIPSLFVRSHAPLCVFALTAWLTVWMSKKRWMKKINPLLETVKVFFNFKHLKDGCELFLHRIHVYVRALLLVSSEPTIFDQCCCCTKCCLP